MKQPGTSNGREISTPRSEETPRDGAGTKTRRENGMERAVLQELRPPVEDADTS